MYVVLTRSPAGNAAWAPYFEVAGLAVYEVPSITTEPVALELDIVRRIGQFDWVVVTSAAGVEHTSVALPGLRRVAAVGRQTAAAAQKAGWAVTFQPSRATAASLGAELPLSSESNILVIRGTLATPNLTTTLRHRGATVTELTAYATIASIRHDSGFQRLLDASQIGCLTFASPSAVASFVTAYPSSLDIPAVVIGTTTAGEARRAGYTRVVVAAAPTPAQVVDTVRKLCSPEV